MADQITEKVGYLVAKAESQDARLDRIETKLDSVLEAHANRISGLEGYKMRLAGALSVLALVMGLLGAKIRALLGF